MSNSLWPEKTEYAKDKEKDRLNFYHSVMCEPTKTLKSWDRAFDAMLAYEKNCITFYDRPNKPSLTPRKGDTKFDFAVKFGTTTKEMDDTWLQVEEAIRRGIK